MLGVPLNAGKGNTKASVIAQATECIRKLRIESIDLFYLHRPDIDTDIDDTLAGIDELHKSGKIKEFVLSITIGRTSEFSRTASSSSMTPDCASRLEKNLNVINEINNNDADKRML